MTLEDYVDHIADGKDIPKITGNRKHFKTGYLPKFRQFGIGYARGIKTSGMLHLYFRGEFYTGKLCSSRFERSKTMKDMLTRLGKLEGERWFIWKPDQK